MELCYPAGKVAIPQPEIGIRQIGNRQSAIGNSPRIQIILKTA
jgi:hypothetical protein